MSITIEKHMKLNRQQRQAHIDLTSPCIPAVIQIGKNKGKFDQQPRKKAKKSLLNYHNMENFNGNIDNIDTCHSCKNNSSMPNGFLCTNPKHLYFGTRYENLMDKPPEKRQEASRAAGKIGGRKGGKLGLAVACRNAIANGNHISQQDFTCPHCGKTGKGPIMKRYHFDNCKNKP